VTIWGEQFDKMIPHFKKGSPIVVFGELQKPEIFKDRDGNPQISLEIWASNIQFSPFGKPDRDGATEKAPFSSTETVSVTQGPTNSYVSAPTHATPGGETFDDEVPF
jgi:single-strand DNA-binding protein